MTTIVNRYVFVSITLAILLFNCSGEQISTPLELASGEILTSYEEMVTFLETLRQETGGFSIEIAGKTVENRDIPLLHFDNPSNSIQQENERLKVLLFAQQHGNEPSGKEALIQLSRDVASGRFDDILREIDLFIIPQINSDGAEKELRRNANDIDLNRDHVTISQPEVAALHNVFQRIMPEVTLDVHEYGAAGDKWVEAGMHKEFGSQVGTVSNPNISMPIRNFCWNRVIPYLEDQLTQKGIGFERYLVVGDPAKRFRFSTTSLNDGRNSLGIYNTISFILEGKNGETVADNIRERTRQQYETILTFLDFFRVNSSDAKILVAAERNKHAQGSFRPDVSIIADYVKDPANPSVTVNVLDLETNRIVEKTFDNFFPLVQSSLSVQRPQGYAIPQDQSEVLDVLRRHNISANQTEKSIQAVVETYMIKGVVLTEIEDKNALDVSVDINRGVSSIRSGYYIVWCNQIQSDLIVALLEPQSIWGLAALPEFSGLLRVGANYPIIRIMRALE